MILLLEVSLDKSKAPKKKQGLDDFRPRVCGQVEDASYSLQRVSGEREKGGSKPISRDNGSGGFSFFLSRVRRQLTSERAPGESMEGSGGSCGSGHDCSCGCGCGCGCDCDCGGQ